MISCTLCINSIFCLLYKYGYEPMALCYIVIEPWLTLHSLKLTNWTLLFFLLLHIQFRLLIFYTLKVLRFKAKECYSADTKYKVQSVILSYQGNNVQYIVSYKKASWCALPYELESTVEGHGSQSAVLRPWSTAILVIQWWKSQSTFIGFALQSQKYVDTWPSHGLFPDCYNKA